jgi:hypothetical protein
MEGVSEKIIWATRELRVIFSDPTFLQYMHRAHWFNPMRIVEPSCSGDANPGRSDLQVLGDSLRFHSSYCCCLARRLAAEPSVLDVLG